MLLLGGTAGFVSRDAHERAVTALAESFRAIPAGSTVRLAKKTSNLFRVRQKNAAPGLDPSSLTGVLSIDRVAMTADVQGMCTYEDLVAATLPYGLAPWVVPQLKTITIGGALTGGGIESTSFRNGLVHEGVAELDVLTGTGEIRTARRDGEHADLFHGFPNSYGSLGYATRVRVRLEPVQPFVALRHVRFSTLEEIQQAIEQITRTRMHDGRQVDYLDGVIFGPGEAYLTLGTLTDEAGPTSDYTGSQIYYRSIQERATDRLTVGDYLWRWDTDWFWCSRAFGAQHPLVRRIWPRRLRRSSFYWKLVALERRLNITDGMQRLRGRPPLERVVQDIEVPVDRTAAFGSWFLDSVPITPIWVCPLRTSPNDAEPGVPRWPLYPIPPDHTYVNFGFWSVVPGRPGEPDGATNRLIEREVTELGGHKSLYSQAYYGRDQFDALYGGSHLRELRRRYDPQSRFLDLYDKAVCRK